MAMLLPGPGACVLDRRHLTRLESRLMQSVRLWHGTTAARAEQIVTEGFHRADSTALLADVASQFDLDVTLVFEWLTEHERFVAVQDQRDDSAWFAATFRAAVRWAQRAPEACWEALWAIWCIREARADDWSPWNDPKAAAWHLRQFLVHKPAVLELQVPIDRLRDNRQQPLSPAEREEYLDLIRDGLISELSVAAPVPAEWVVGYSRVERRVSFTAAAGLFGITTEELASIVEKGELPSCREPDHPGLEDWYWTVEDLSRYRLL